MLLAKKMYWRRVRRERVEQKNVRMIERDGPEGKIKMLHNNNSKQPCGDG